MSDSEIQCHFCLLMKPTSDFTPDRSTKRGFKLRCKPCANARARRYNESERAKKVAAQSYQRKKAKTEFQKRMIEYNTIYRETLEGRARHLLSGARNSSVSLHNPCTITFEHILKGLQTGVCAATGLPFDLSQKHKSLGRRNNPFAPSVDRIDCRLGYTNGNTRIVLWQYNAMKGQLTDTEVYLIAKAFVIRTERDFT